MALRNRWRLEFLQETQNHLFRHWISALFVPGKNQLDRRLNVNNLDWGSVINKQINPALARLSRDVRCVEGKVLAGAQVFTTLLSRHLDGHSQRRRITSEEIYDWFRVAHGEELNTPLAQFKAYRSAFGELRLQLP